MVSPGNYSENIDLLGKSVQVIGFGGAAATLLSPVAAEPIMVVQNSVSARLEGLTFAGGSLGTGSGAGVRAAGSGVVIVDCVFDQNSTGDGDGAALSASSCTLTVEGCTFSGNQSQASVVGSGLGGAVSITDGTALLRACIFENNLSREIGGGGMGVSGAAVVTVVGGRFSGNVAATTATGVADTFGGGGGAALRGSASLTINGTIFENNSLSGGSGSGGAIRVIGTGNAADLRVADATFRNNRAGGAGISYNAGGVLEVRGSLFEANAATNSTAGAIAAAFTGAAPGPDGLVIEGCTFRNNAAGIAGAIDNSTRLTVTDSVFAGNQALGAQSGSFILSGGSGAVRTSSGTQVARFVRCRFEGNTANSGAIPGNEGGAVRVRRSPAVFVDCTFTGNTAVNNRGGALWFESLSSMLRASTITNCTFTGNTVTGTQWLEGGAIGATGRVNLTIETSTFAENHAPTAGSHIWGEANLDGLTLRGCTLRDATSRSGGGVIWPGAANCTIRLENTTFRNLAAVPNASNQGGDYGAINATGAAIIVRNVLAENCSGRLHGGVRLVAGTATATVDIDGLTLHNCDAIPANNTGGDYGGGEINCGSSAGGTSIIRNLLVEDCNAKNWAGLRVGGHTVTIEDGVFNRCVAAVDANQSGGDVGGLRLDAINGTARRLTFRDCAAKNAGGFLGISGGTTRLEDSTFINCRAIPTSSDSWGDAGGANLETTNVIVRRTTFTNCDARIGGGLRVGGGGAGSTAALSDLTFINCDATTTTTSDTSARGGAMFLDRGGINTITDVSMTGGSARRGGGLWAKSTNLSVTNLRGVGNTAVMRGGGIFFEGPSSVGQFVNLLLANNSAGERGGGLYADGAGTATSIINATIVHNAGGGVILGRCDLGPVSSIANSIIRGNTTLADIGLIGCAGTIPTTYSNVSGGYPGTGNIDADPLFTDAVGGVFTLVSGSPGIDAANNAAVPAGLTTDLAGESRFTDDPGTADTGAGTAPIVDMGAFEYIQTVTCPSIEQGPADLQACGGSEAMFTVTAAGTAPFSYVWTLNGDVLSDGPLPSGAVVSGATTQMLTIMHLVGSNAGVVAVTVSNACGSTPQEEVDLTICVGDYNCDGGVDGSDVEAFFSVWEAGESGADVNEDGGVDGGDVEFFFARWEGGC